jgi:hypothetical protein
MADPIKSNLLSNTCGELTSSNCVTWAGPNLVGLSLCRGATLTDVIYALNNSCCNQGLSPCYTGEWVSLVPTIPPSGTAGSTTWTLNNFGISQEFSLFLNTEDVPGYRWTKDGNIQLRGTSDFTFVSFVGTEVFSIPLGTVSTTCLPAGMKAQSHLISVDLVDANQRFVIFCKSYVRITSSGTLELLLSIRSLAPFTGRYVLGLGGVTFNL